MYMQSLTQSMVWVRASSQLCPNLWDLMDCSPPGTTWEALEPGICQYSETNIINTIAINVPFQTAC